MTCARIILALLLLAPTSPTMPTIDTHARSATEIVARTTEQRLHAEWALSRFAAAGLQLPSLRIVFHDNYRDCGMREGVLRVSESDNTVERTIHSCERDPGRLRRNLLHEFSHAWSGAISASTRADFLRLRGLHSWNSDALPWNQRGEEQAAEIMAWGLMERHAPIPTDVGDYGAQDPDHLAAAFTLLTGRIPLFPTGHQADALAQGFTFHGATDAEASKMVWAIRRFHNSGLELPRLDIYFEDGCQQRFGAFGRFQMTSAAPPWRIEVCTSAVYLHELAHAWDRWNLTDQDRRRFLDLRGLDSWQGSEVPWAQRGTEELAQLIARVLGQGVNNHPSEEQLTDFDHFEQVTGASTPIVRVTGVDTSPPY